MAEDPKKPPGPIKNYDQLIPLIQASAYLVITVAILGAVAWGIFGTGSFFQSIAKNDVARGLITFLIALTTVGIAIILALSTIYGDAGELGDKRFDRGKQVLTTLIGVLGTIVGFYFGSTTDNNSRQPTSHAAPQQQALAIAPARLSNAQPKKGEKTTISSFVIGGKAPFTYSITFDSTLPAIKDKLSPDGLIKEDVIIPETLDADKDVTYQISIRDSDGKTANYNEDGAQKIALKVR